MTHGTNPTTDADSASAALVGRDPEQSVLEAGTRPTWTANVVPPSQVLWVTANGGPDDALDELNGSLERLPDQLDVLPLDECIRSTTASAGPSATTIPFDPCDLTVHTLGDCDGLGRLGSAIVDIMKESSDSEDLVVVVDDLAPLLARHDLEDVFLFVHVLRRAVLDRNGSLRVGIDRSAVDETTIRTLQPLFDDR